MPGVISSASRSGGTLRLVLGDQLTPTVAALRDINPARDTVLMAEVAAEATYVRHHKKKIAFIFSAMRHFAEDLRQGGIRVRYVRLDEPGNTGMLSGEIARAIAELKPERLVTTFPGEYRLAQVMQGWARAFDLPVEVREDDRFIASRADFAAYAGDRKSLRMEFFYREMRRKTGILMRPDGEPEGGRWNLDRENRKSLPANLPVPPRHAFDPDATTRAVLDLVAHRFPHHFGDLEPFGFAVTAAQAEDVFAQFLTAGLPRFGDYQDAMRLGDDTLFHAVIAPYLNIGLLDPLDVCRRAEAEYRAGRVPLNAAEGFIRQILGWREYVRGLYWLKMPSYAESNALGADRPLPDFYWTAETEMRCLAACIDQTRREAYAHHIQRLMVTGNFALLAGLSPAEVEEWYLLVYADAFEWVELPNTHGMALFADGGVLGSKPYAASGAYINRMSDYCDDCRYSPKETVGAKACPFNFLYWDFLMRHRALLARNQRVGPILGNIDRMTEEKRAAIRAQASAFLDGIAPRPPQAQGQAQAQAQGHAKRDLVSG
jgi:deoxyribodipyrimidine photolyase-related protein